MMLAQRQRVSVVMAVYNSEAYIRETISSVLNQTYSNFEFIIVDDGSKDATCDIIRSFNDARIRLLQNEQNRGISFSVNRCIDLASGEFIARMDGDDICVPHRFEKQVEFLCDDRSVGFVGSRVVPIDHRGRQHREDRFRALSDGQIRFISLFAPAFIQPTVMMRHSIVKENNLRYRGARGFAEDFDFWVRFLKVAKAANIQDPLLYYRMHSASETTVKETPLIQSHAEIVREQISNTFSMEIDVHKSALLYDWFFGRNLHGFAAVREIPSTLHCVHKIRKMFLARTELNPSDRAFVDRHTLLRTGRYLRNLAINAVGRGRKTSLREPT